MWIRSSAQVRHSVGGECPRGRGHTCLPAREIPVMMLSEGDGDSLRRASDAPYGKSGKRHRASHEASRACCGEHAALATPKAAVNGIFRQEVRFPNSRGWDRFEVSGRCALEKLSFWYSCRYCATTGWRVDSGGIPLGDVGDCRACCPEARERFSGPMAIRRPPRGPVSRGRAARGHCFDQRSIIRDQTLG
jgi:hypothetical protein